MNANCFFNSLTVGCWNIEGIYQQGLIAVSTYLTRDSLSAQKNLSHAKKLYKKKKQKRETSKSWYTKECKARRSALLLRSMMLSKDPFNLNCHDLFVKARTAYKKTCRKAEKVLLIAKLHAYGEPIAYKCSDYSSHKQQAILLASSRTRRCLPQNLTTSLTMLNVCKC